MSINIKALEIMQNLKRKTPELNIYYGFGYCGYGSKLLYDELKKNNIESDILVGEYFTTILESNAAKKEVGKIITSIKDKNGIYKDIKDLYIKRGNKLPNRTGHAVIVIDDTVYDITSGQFSLPETYSLKQFKSMWKNVNESNIILNKDHDTFYIKEVIKNKNISLENMTTNDYQDILDWFLIQAPKVQENAKIISAKELGQDFHLHIDKNLVKAFLPMFPRSASSSECNTVARITVAPTLLGCMIGYFRCLSDFMDGAGEHIKGDPFRGGYIIEAIPCQHSIQPNKALVFDAERSGEHWLVNYSQETVDYPSIEIGKVFITEVNMVAGAQKEPEVNLTVYIFHNKATGIKLNNSVTLEPGYYKALIKYSTQATWDVNNENFGSVEKITEEQYLDRKKLSAALLSRNDVPNFLKW